MALPSGIPPQLRITLPKSFPLPRLMEIGAVTLLAAACYGKSVDKQQGATQNDTAPVSQQTESSSTAAVTAPVRVAPETTSTIHRVDARNSHAELTCAPTTFGPGDTLTLRMHTPHGHYLWVTRSDRIAYLIVYPAQGELKAAYSLVPADDFTGVATIQLPSEIEAIPYVYGRDTIRERVFGEPGKYLLEVGDNFGTDLGTPPSSCNLTFVRHASK